MLEGTHLVICSAWTRTRYKATLKPTKGKGSVVVLTRTGCTGIISTITTPYPVTKQALNIPPPMWLEWENE